MPDQSIYNKVLDVYQFLKNFYRERELKILSMYEKATGNLFDAEDKAELLDQKRPVLEYNLLEPKRNAWIGTERSSRVNMRCVPNKGGSNRTAFYLTSALYWNYGKTWYDWEKSKQFIHTLIGGIGWGTDYWDFSTGHWVWRAFDALRIRFDPMTQNPLLFDCRYLEDSQWLTAEEIKNLATDRETKKEIEYKFKFHEPNSNKFYDKFRYGYWGSIKNAGTSDEDYTDFRDGRYRCVDHHEQRDEKFIAIMNKQTEQVVDGSGMTEQQIDKFIQKYSEYYEVFEILKKKFYNTIICPAINYVVYDAPYAVDGIFYAFKPQFAYDIKPELYHTQPILEGDAKIVEGYNKRQSVLLEYNIDTIGGEWIAEDDAISGYEDEWKSRAKVFVRHYKAGTQKPERASPGQIPATVFQYANNELELLNRGTIGLNYRGVKESANESGKLADTKIQQTEMMIQHIFDNVRLSQYMDAYSAIKHIQKYMTEEQKIKLLGKEEYVVLNQETIQGKVNNLDDGDYDVEIDTTRPSATARQYGFQLLVGLMQYVPIDMLNIVKVLEASDIPFAYELADFARARYKSMGIDPDNPNQAGVGPPQMGNPPVSQAGQQGDIGYQPQYPSVRQNILQTIGTKLGG